MEQPTLTGQSISAKKRTSAFHIRIFFLNMTEQANMAEHAKALSLVSYLRVSDIEYFIGPTGDTHIFFNKDQEKQANICRALALDMKLLVHTNWMPKRPSVEVWTQLEVDASKAEAKKYSHWLPETNPVLAQACWDKFIKHLQEEYPLGSKKEPLEYKNLMGSIKRFESIFMEANIRKE